MCARTVGVFAFLLALTILGRSLCPQGMVQRRSGKSSRPMSDGAVVRILPPVQLTRANSESPPLKRGVLFQFFCHIVDPKEEYAY